MISNISLSFGSKTDSGKVSEFNKDAIIDFPILDGHVFVVCDGHDGDEGHGALASKLTTEQIKKYFYNQSYKDIQKALTNAISFANYSVFELANKDAKYNGIGSTIAIVIYRGGKIYYAYAGDSRIYLIRDGELKPLTRDHVSNTEDIANSEVSVLIGKNKDIKFGVSKNPLQVVEDDQFLLCTDGVSDCLNDEEISSVLADENLSAEHKAHEIIKKVNEKEGADNASVHVLNFTQTIQQKKSSKKPNKKVLFAIGAVVVLSTLVVGVLFNWDNITSSFTANNESVKQEIIEKPEETVKPKLDLPVKTNENRTEKVNENKEEPETKMPKVEPKKEMNQVVYHKHLVQYGENLYRLGLRYNVSQQKLIEINQNKAKNLIAGSVIKIPVLAIYEIKDGDSYSVVSDKFNVKIDAICEANKIDRNKPLKKGQKIIIPRR